jgi:hypothetical protein
VGYYLRAFCTSNELPAVQVLVDHMAGEGLDVRAQATPPELDAPRWSDALLWYGPEREPLSVDVTRAGGADGLLEAEVAEFVEFLEGIEDSDAKQRVIAHLQASRAVVGVQFLGDVDDDALRAAHTLLGYLVDHCGGLIQADNEGFYEGERLVVELE